MEILINTHRAGFAQGSAGCHVAGGPQTRSPETCSRSPVGPRSTPASARPSLCLSPLPGPSRCAGCPPRLPIQGATTADMEGARDQPFLRDPSGKPRTGCSRRARPPTLSVLVIHKGADVDSRPAWWRDFPQWLLGEGHPSLTSEPQGLRPRPDLTQLPPALVSTETPEILPVSPPRSGWGLLSALARAAVLGLLWPGLQGSGVLGGERPRGAGCTDPAPQEPRAGQGNGRPRSPWPHTDRPGGWCRGPRGREGDVAVWPTSPWASLRPAWLSRRWKEE